MSAMGSARGAYAALGVGLVLVAAYLPTMSDGRGAVVYLLVGLYATLLSVVGARRMPRARRRIWWAFAFSQVTFLVGDTLWNLFVFVLHIEPFPSVADVSYLLTYPALALGMLWLVRGRRRGRDRAAFLDAAILTTGFTVVGVVFFVTPAAAAGGSTLLARGVAAAYPVGDLLVLAMVLRLFTAGLARNASLWALIGCIGTLLVADLGYVASVVVGSAYPSWIDPTFLVSYLLLGFAAVHPSAHTLSEPVADTPDRLTVTRVVLLGAALMLAPLTALAAHLTGVTGGTWVVAVGGCVASVLVVLRLGDVVQNLQRSAVQLAALARRDGLTGIPNRRTWDHELSRACAFARDHDAPLTVAVLDMDRFKQFNDSFGHLKGDLVLKETAAAWSQILEGRGFVARFGGEEFAALVPGMTADDAVGVLERMRGAVTHCQTVSIGAATWNGTEAPAGLVARADRALYRAKDAGRDRIAIDHGTAATVVSAAPTPDPVLASIRSVYQPVVEIESGRVTGFEALSRFDGHDPADVFERAAREGRSAELESAAVRAALAGFPADGVLGLNVSLTALSDPRLLAALPHDLSNVVLEITESDVVNYSAEMMLLLEGMRERGARLAIDDFGVGFSNIERVLTLRPDIVKLDMSIIRDVDRDEMRQAVVAGALLFAERTGAILVAEGIETAAELDRLVGLGVQYGQGFLLGRPGPLPGADGAAPRVEVRSATS